MSDMLETQAENGRKRGKIKMALMVVGAILLVIGGTIGMHMVNNTYEFRWDMDKVWKAGFVEKKVSLGDKSVINYAEGPNNGPALLLIHGQTGDWKSYDKNLPELSKHYHIFAVDCYGHGGSSKNAEKYSANANGQDLKWFIENVIREKAIVSGHSSGGLLTAWLAANAPEDVLGVVLEDPPFFSCEDGRKEKAYNWNDLSTACHTYLNQSKETDFTMWYFEHQYWLKFLPDGGKKALCNMAKNYRKTHPHEILAISLLPQSFMLTFNAMENYDPMFGETFYNGTWNKGFDHAGTLAKIKCPAVLIHAGFSYRDGILLGAMDDQDAARAKSMIANCTFERVDCMHAVHALKEDKFNQIMIDFLKRI